MPMNRSLTVDDYIKEFPENVRQTLNKLRSVIHAAAPEAEEVVSYGIPAFKQNGMLVGFGAAKNHCALYVMSPQVMEIFKPSLDEYDTSKATVRFGHDTSIPSSLIKKIVKERLKENEILASERKQKLKKT